MEYNILGDIYQQNTNLEIRKSIGQYYTPDFIIRYILGETVGKANIVENPFIRVIDISCGAGYFLILAYDILKKMFLLNLEDLRDKYEDEIYNYEKPEGVYKLRGFDYWREENLHYHILRHCIYGADKDGLAVNLTKIGLLNKDPNKVIKELNILECDSLIKWEEEYENEKDLEEANRLRDFWTRKYDYVIGNPPYIGHKQLDMDYKRWLLKEYDVVYKDKSDISFCFFKRIADILSPRGLAGIISSRYFMESPTGRKLRGYLVDSIDILQIVDFYGAEIFKGIGVATAIYFFKNKRKENNKIVIHKLKDDRSRFRDLENLQEVINTNLFESFSMKQKNLDIDRWLLISKENRSIYEKIINKSRKNLRDIVESFQGIITGCDKAFVLSIDEVNKNNIERNLLKRWIKNRNVERYRILESDLLIIYSDLINDEKDYPNSIQFIDNYRERLENRRECKNGSRKWYELQWGRDMTLFQQPKIVFPYKSNRNRFAVDYNNVCCSADVYSIIIKDQYKDKISLEYLVGLLNSSVYELYFKLFAKKIGKGMYDYYPNSVLDMRIITEDIIFDVENRVKEIMELGHRLDKNKSDHEIIQEKIYELEEEIDLIIADYFKLNEKELEICKKIKS